jgi:hypothetical protein
MGDGAIRTLTRPLVRSLVRCRACLRSCRRVMGVRCPSAYLSVGANFVRQSDFVSLASLGGTVGANCVRPLGCDTYTVTLDGRPQVAPTVQINHERMADHRSPLRCRSIMNERATKGCPYGADQS